MLIQNRFNPPGAKVFLPARPMESPPIEQAVNCRDDFFAVIC